MTWIRIEDVEVAKLVSPPYTAVKEWLPTLSVEIFNVAIPPDSVPVPIVVAPSLNVTVPVGATGDAPWGTVAVNRMFCWKTDGLTEDAKLVVDEV